MNQKEIIEKVWNNHLDWLIKETKKVFKRDSDLFTPKIEVILSRLLFKLVSDFTKLSKKSTINAIEEVLFIVEDEIEEVLSIVEDDYQNRLARAERMSRQGLMERDKQIQSLERIIKELKEHEDIYVQQIHKLETEIKALEADSLKER